MKYAATWLFGGLLVLALASCGDPLANVAEAKTGEAQKETTEEGDKLSFNGENSEVGWTGTKTGGKHDGGFNEFEGTVTVKDGEVKQVDVTIQVKSMWTDEDDADPDEDKLKGHLLSDDFFSADEFPTARFVTTKIEEGGEGGTHTVTGNLTLRGKTKSVTFPADITVKDETVTAKAEFKINRMEWGVRYQITGGEVILHDEVAIRFDIKAEK